MDLAFVYAAFAAILFLIVGLAFMLVRAGGQRQADYRALFILGIVWFGAGVVLSFNWLLMGLGLLFALIGAARSDRWGKEKAWVELSPKQRALKIVLTGLGLALLLLGAAIYAAYSFGLLG